jgi:two-component system, response regulator PdtaR
MNRHWWIEFFLRDHMRRLMTSNNTVVRTTVLLMESKAEVRTGVAAFLNEKGFNTIETESPREAWTTLESRSDVRVLLADLDTGSGADGLELARKVHDRWPSIGLVITSDHVRHLRPSDIPGDGCFLPRPLPAETLLHEVAVAADQIAA